MNRGYYLLEIDRKAANGGRLHFHSIVVKANSVTISVDLRLSSVRKKCWLYFCFIWTEHFDTPSLSLAVIVQSRRNITGAFKVFSRWEILQKYKQGNHLFGPSPSSIREVWDAFISLSETEQIELLGSLTSHSDFSIDDDVDMGDDLATHPPPRNYNSSNRNNSGGRRRRRNKGRSRRRPVVHLEPISEDPMEMSVDAFSKVLIFDPLKNSESGLNFRMCWHPLPS